MNLSGLNMGTLEGWVTKHYTRGPGAEYDCDPQRRLAEG